MSQSEPVAGQPTLGGVLVHLTIGAVFGFVATRGEIISWFRIQEMFRFQDVHMYGVIGSAVAVGALGLLAIRRSGLTALSGAEITEAPKEMGRGYRVALGGTLFGLGWGLTGACPGPIYALVGNGVVVMAVVLLGALAGTWVYGHVRSRLPH